MHCEAGARKYSQILSKLVVQMRGARRATHRDGYRRRCPARAHVRVRNYKGRFEWGGVQKADNGRASGVINT